MNEDWRYSDQKMKLRQEVYKILLKRFGSDLDKEGKPMYNMKSITECAHDWVSQGNMRSDGIVAYFKAYYGGVSEWLKEGVCKTSGSAYVGSNPTSSTLESCPSGLRSSTGNAVWGQPHLGFKSLTLRLGSVAQLDRASLF